MATLYPGPSNERATFTLSSCSGHQPGGLLNSGMGVPMKSLIRVLPVVGLLLLAACRASPVYNVESAPLGASEDATIDEVTEAIKRAGIGLGWQMKPEKEGQMTGRLALRSHVAVVEIKYDTKRYSIYYLDSANLIYDGRNIHRNYNSWVKILSNAIKLQASPYGPEDRRVGVSTENEATQKRRVCYGKQGDLIQKNDLSGSPGTCP